MRIIGTCGGVAAVLAVCAVAAPARADALAVKTGLWEVTLTGGSRPAIPQIPAEALAKMSPEQQAMVKQRLAAAAGGPKGLVVHQVCVTPATLQNGFGATSLSPSCSRTVVSSTPKALELKLVCTGKREATGSFKVEAADAETVNGAIELHMTMMDGTPMAMSRAMQGHWVAADCGSVKPHD